VPKPLVIVESPAKAKTIAKFLGSDYDVRASVGHIADLPSSGLQIDVDHGFVPNYELTPRGKDIVKDLRALLKGASELYLATDEDREGEMISAHLVEYLKPPKSVPVKRMVFHEITRSAIERAVANPRQIDTGLVAAAEGRRILDRLYGYEVSPVLWRKVNRGLAAGRVQSPSVRLVVEREWERMRFVAAGYWDLEALFSTTPGFGARLVNLDGRKVATGRDFDESGRAKSDLVVLDEGMARGLAARLEHSSFEVTAVDAKPYRSSPRAPFMTSTLQQEGGRKLRMSSQQVMRVAQGLYERGYITYMRTDSPELSTEAVDEARNQIASMYGKEFLAPSGKRYSGKVKNAQEAHEAIRPTTPFRAPASLRTELSGPDLRLYEMVWQRTLASQMADATGTTTTVRLKAEAAASEVASDPRRCEFSASGTTIGFAGYRRVYVESSDDDAPGDDEALLPAVTVGQRLPLDHLDVDGHVTSPPARYTEASLVKKLEELGIGRPSTWASIMQTIQDRGYVWKKGQALVPTWTAFVVVRLLENHFKGLVDYSFTAGMEAELDRIATGEADKVEFLHRFYFGDGNLGLKDLVNENLDLIDAAEINAIHIGHDADGAAVVVRPGRYGPYVKRGEDTAGVPENLPPDELSLERALELLAAPKTDASIGEFDGLPVYAKNGRFGPYVQWGDSESLPAGLDKPKMASLFSTMTLETLTLDDAVKLLSLPRVLGSDPADGVEVTAQNGRYGPYVAKGTESRSLGTEPELFTVGLDAALTLLAAPKQFRGRGRGPAKPPLRDFGADPVSSKPIVAKEGRFGVYVTDGETNASIGKGDRIEDMTAERAQDLLVARREMMAERGETGGRPTRRGKSAPRATARTVAKGTSSAAKRAGGAAKQAGGATKKVSGAATRTGGAAKKAGGAAKKAGGAARKAGGAAKRVPGVAKKARGA
jgi:DNA topoisomerase I